MPKPPNKTDWDTQMTKFKVTPNPNPPRSSSSRRNQSSRNPHPTPGFQAPATVYQHLPNSNTYNSHPPSTSGYFPPQHAASVTGARPSNHSQSYASQPVSQQNYGTYYAQPSASSTQAQPSTSQVQRACWTMELFAYPWDGAPLTRRMPIVRGQMPQTTCICGCEATIRILHLPTITDWQPPFGVLWNFILQSNGSNNWVEGVTRNNSISAAQCPYCNSYLALYGPSNFQTMV